MDCRVIWSELALGDLRGLVRYIARDDRKTAERFGNLMISKAEILAVHPRIGRIVPEFHVETLREIIMSPYRIVYRIDDERKTVSVLRVWHGARGNLELQA